MTKAYWWLIWTVERIKRESGKVDVKAAIAK